MKGVLVPADGAVTVVELNGTWQEMADIVGGYIEIVRVPMPFPGDVMVIDDEGLYKNYGMNLLGSFLYGTHIHRNPIVGDMLILQEGIGPDGADFIDMPDARAHRAKYEEILQMLQAEVPGADE